MEAAAVGGRPLLVLFPDPVAQNLETVARQLHTHTALAESSAGRGDGSVGIPAAEAGTETDDPRVDTATGTLVVETDAKRKVLDAGNESGLGPAYTLLVLDGTWQQGREMWAACAPAMLPVATPVCLPAGAGGAQHVRLKMEPGQGCTSTCEAVAEALRLLEPRGDDLAAALLAPLELLSVHQARWDPAVAARRRGEGGMYAEGKGRFNIGASVAAAAAAGGLGSEGTEKEGVPGSMLVQTPLAL